MQYKAIILDVDGTCVPSGIHSKPSARVISAIRKAQEKGIFVCIATSRPIFIATEVIAALGIKDLCAINDATQLYDPNTKKVVETFPLSKHAITAVSKYFVEHNLKFMVNSGHEEQWYAAGAFPDVVCSLCIPELSVSEADELIRALTHIPDIAVQKPPSFSGDKVWASVTSSVATKLHCVMEITKMLEIRPEETIGVGDGYNDFPLLSACGLKVAMGNAVPELKAIADVVAPTVDEDGVATVIEKFLLI